MYPILNQRMLEEDCLWWRNVRGRSNQSTPLPSLKIVFFLSWKLQNRNSLRDPTRPLSSLSSCWYYSYWYSRRHHIYVSGFQTQTEIQRREMVSFRFKQNLQDTSTPPSPIVAASWTIIGVLLTIISIWRIIGAFFRWLFRPFFYSREEQQKKADCEGSERTVCDEAKLETVIIIPEILSFSDTTQLL